MTSRLRPYARRAAALVLTAAAATTLVACGDSGDGAAADAGASETVTKNLEDLTCAEAIQVAYDRVGTSESSDDVTLQALTACKTPAKYQKEYENIWYIKDDLSTTCTASKAARKTPVCSRLDIKAAARQEAADAAAARAEIEKSAADANTGSGDTYSIQSAIDANIGSGETDYGAPRAATVECQTRSCLIHYNADTPLYDPEGKLLDGTRPIFQAAFAAFPKADVQITVGGETTSVGGKKSVNDVLIITCSPSANDQIDWSVVDAGGLKALCDYQALVNFE